MLSNASVAAKSYVSDNDECAKTPKTDSYDSDKCMSVYLSTLSKIKFKAKRNYNRNDIIIHKTQQTIDNTRIKEKYLVD